jgi:signal transduction histidine kinase/CheY-like chemotaxis protein
MPAAQDPASAAAAAVAHRLPAEQVAALFKNVALGVLGAAAAAAILAGLLIHLGFLSWSRGLAWSGYIAACAVAHLLLRHAYRQAADADTRWRRWAARFTAIALAEGLGWGWASVFLIGYGRFEAEIFVLLICTGVATGAIPAFSAYLPAFYVLFLPATVPYALWSLTAPDLLQQASVPLMLVYIFAIGGLGFIANRTFKEVVGLRIRTHTLAEDLRQQKEIAEQASLAKSTFLAAASHDLRQPVHALGLFVGALRGVPMSPDGVRFVGRIEESVLAMSNMLGTLLDISRLDAGVVEVDPEIFAIGALLERLCGDYAEEAWAKGIHLACRPCSAIVRTDPILMERILRNLISNAVRYTERGRIVVGCRRGQMLRIEVWDTGPGIPPEQQERIFQEYVQLDNPERDRAKGLGLGLAIVRRLTALLGCTVSLRTWPGRGSCFSVTVPVADRGSPYRDVAGETAGGALARGFVVVIDDEPAIREAMSELLTAWGHEVVAAGSGDEMLNRLVTYPVRPDLIVCDYRLRANENGIEVVERLRSEYNEPIPALLMTGDTAPDRLVEAKDSGLMLLHKPVSHSDLREALGRLMTMPQDDEAPLEPDALSRSNL